MKRKHRLGKGISLLLAISLLLGVTVVGTFAEDSGAGDAVAQSETTTPPSIGYKRITMADYTNKSTGLGIEAPTSEEGKTYSSSLSGTYTGTSMDKTYIDVDINFNGNLNVANYYFHFFGSADWTDNIRFIPKQGGYTVYRGNNVLVDDDRWISCATAGFLNLKLYTDIVENAQDSTKDDVTIRVYVENELVETLAWTENENSNHNNFYFYCPNGSFSLRTPQPWEDYKRITLENYGIDASEAKEGNPYLSSTSGTYTGDTLNKTYLDVDINFEGNVYQSDAVGPYIRFFGISDNNWAKDVWIKLIDTHVIIADKCNPKRDIVQTGDIWKTLSSMNASLDEFFNLKILTDIVANEGDATKNDVRIQYYINNIKAGEMAWTEDADETHSNLQFYSPNSSFSLRTPLLPEDIDYKYEISDYRKTTVEATMGGELDKYYEAYPEKTGYVFGGWYSDVYLTEPLDFSVTTGYAYAKFVPEDVLTVKFQKLVNASKEDETTKLRTITSVDSLEYEYVGFKRVVDGDANTEKVYTTKSVFKTIKGMVNGETYTYTPSAISADAEYLMALSINKIPQSVYESTITITPLWKTLDGTIVTGQARDTQLFETEVEGGTTLYGGEDFANDNEAYYQNRWIY